MRDAMMNKILASLAGTFLGLIVVIGYNAITTYNAVNTLEKSLDQSNDKLNIYISKFYDLKSDVVRNQNSIVDMQKNVDTNNSTLISRINDLNAIVNHEKDRLTRANKREFELYKIIMEKYFK